ncbi:MAG: SH3 domain-containing protein [Clostridia bacterium]|nr:SH3 domain-containing protein [Clostridia bacterium]
MKAIIRECIPMKTGRMGLGRFAFFLLLFVLCFSCALAAAEEYAVVYGTDQLNLRAQASSSSGWLGSYQRGTWVAVTGESGNWYLVRAMDGKTGYMSKNYLTKGPTQAVQIGVVDNTSGGRFLNFRQQPSYNAAVLGILYDGVPMTLTSRDNGWLQVNVNGTSGYVRAEYVTYWYGPANPLVATIKTPNNSVLNLRAAPNSDAQVLAQVKGDRYVMVLAKGSGWWRVVVDNLVGFMSSDFLQDGLKSAKDMGGNLGGNVAAKYALVSNPKNTQYLNLREYPNASSRVLAHFTNGTRLTVNAQGTQWCHVTVNTTGESGYMMTRYLELHNLPGVPTLTIVHPKKTYVNLRQSQSLTAPVLTRIPHGATVTVVSPETSWYQVQYGNQTGYVAAYFLQ